MKKKNILNLIKYYSEKNDIQFRNEAYDIARDFDSAGDYQLAEYIMSLLSKNNVFYPQVNDDKESFFKKVDVGNESLPLPKAISDDIVGMINAINHNAGINKFMFIGAPGTGKTETVKQVARLLERQLFMIDTSELIDSKLGQTAKNISDAFAEINTLPYPAKVLILIDELDSIALDRINNNDLREMGRVTSAFFKELDNLNENIVLVATTNLFERFDKALTRRFDSIIDFNRYTKEDLVEVAESILNTQLKRFKTAGHDMKLFKKIINCMTIIPYPGELKNLIRSSIAFSNPNNEFDYLRRMIRNVIPNIGEISPNNLQKRGFTIREIEVLTGVSKSSVQRELKGENHE
ncbi:MAG: ATP-binding protein [Candidatus Izemoplasmatales bacterium]